LRLILLFNRIRYENKINIEIRGCFEILESFVGERVNKIRFDGSINKEIRSELFYVRFWKKGEKPEKEKRNLGGLRFLQN